MDRRKYKFAEIDDYCCQTCTACIGVFIFIGVGGGSGGEDTNRGTKFSRIISRICVVYGWTPDFVLWTLSLPQLFLWFERAIEEDQIKLGIKIEDELGLSVDEIKDGFEWDSDKGCYIGVD